MPQATLITEISRTRRNQLGGPLRLLLCKLCSLLWLTPLPPCLYFALTIPQLLHFTAQFDGTIIQGQCNLDLCGYKLHATMVAWVASEPWHNWKLILSLSSPQSWVLNTLLILHPYCHSSKFVCALTHCSFFFWSFVNSFKNLNSRSFLFLK